VVDWLRILSGIRWEASWSWSAACAGFVQRGAALERVARLEGCGSGALCRCFRWDAAVPCSEEWRGSSPADEPQRWGFCCLQRTAFEVHKGAWLRWYLLWVGSEVCPSSSPAAVPPAAATGLDLDVFKDLQGFLCNFIFLLGSLCNFPVYALLDLSRFGHVCCTLQGLTNDMMWFLKKKKSTYEGRE
jgi:hypothetical protein